MLNQSGPHGKVDEAVIVQLCPGVGKCSISHGILRNPLAYPNGLIGNITRQPFRGGAGGGAITSLYKARRHRHTARETKECHGITFDFVLFVGVVFASPEWHLILPTAGQRALALKQISVKKRDARQNRRPRKRLRRPTTIEKKSNKTRKSIVNEWLPPPPMPSSAGRPIHR